MGDKINININEIKSPEFLKSLNYDELKETAEKIRNRIIEVTSKQGGHLSSNLGVVELTMALHRNFNFLKDKILFDVSHQCYTHKILTGRDITHIREKDNISGFIKFNESIYDVFESGHSSTSLSAAYAYALDRDNKKEHYEVVALIGDASIANGVAFEALNNIANKGHKVIIILNDNNMAIGAPVGRLSNVFRSLQTSKHYFRFKKGIKKIFKIFKPFYNLALRIKNWFKRKLIPINIFDNLGYTYIGAIDGHDFKALDKALKKAKECHNSVVVHVKTIKGRGYKYAENDQYGYWHGVSAFDVKTGEVPHNPNKVSWSEVYSEFVYERMKNDEKMYLICPGTLTGSSLEKLHELYPNRVIDVGIAEEHAVVLAGYLAHLGYHVCVSIYSTFMQRSIDEISHDLARINASVTFLVDRAGLVGKDGDTHQGIYDGGYLTATPNVNIAMARNVHIAKSLFISSFNNKQATFIRYPRNYVDKEEAKTVSLTDYDTLQDVNSNVALVGVGPLLNDLANILKDVNVDIFDPIYTKPISSALISRLFKYSKIIIYSPYETSFGFASLLIHELHASGFKGAILSKAVPNEFIKQATIDEQLEEFGLSVAQIKDFILKEL